MAGKIDKDKLIGFLSHPENTKADAARLFGVSRAAISKSMKPEKRHIPKIIALERAEKFVEYQMNLMEQYRESMRSLNKLKDSLEKLIYEGDLKVFAQMQRKIESKSVEQDEGGKEEESKQEEQKDEKAQKIGKGRKTRSEIKVEKFYTQADPKVVLVQVNRAIKEYLSLQVEVFNACGDPRIMIEILNRIIETMGRISPDAKSQIEEILKRDQLIRSVITFNSTDQEDLRS